MAKIKLFKLSEDNGVVRLQSQLVALRGGCDADFILDNGVLKAWGYSKDGGGADFLETNEPYEIVTDINEMKYQAL